jgi:hypothetical protein
MRFDLFFKILLVFFIFLTFSCEDAADCNYEANRKVKLAFASKSGSKYNDTTIVGLVVTTSKVKVLYDTVSANQVGLQLSQVNDSSTFYFSFDSIPSDTLIFISTRKLQMISSNCGFNTRFTIDSILYTTHNITDIQIVERNIDKDLDMGRNCRVIIRKKK